MRPIGQIGSIRSNEHFPGGEDVKYSRIYLGAAWPAARPGWIVVVGECLLDRVGGLPKLIVLDEASDERLWHVVDRTAALWWYYRPERALADCSHVAAMQFAANVEYVRRGFRLEASLLCAMKGPFNYAFPILARMQETGRLDVPRSNRLTGELMTAPRHEDLAKLALADYPAIAALAFAVIELEKTRDEGVSRPTETVQPKRILE